VPGPGISLGQIQRAWRSLRGNARTLSGEIMEADQQYHFYVRLDGQAARKCSGARAEIKKRIETVR